MESKRIEQEKDRAEESRRSVITSSNNFLYLHEIDMDSQLDFSSLEYTVKYCTKVHLTSLDYIGPHCDALYQT